MCDRRDRITKESGVRWRRGMWVFVVKKRKKEEGGE